MILPTYLSRLFHGLTNLPQSLILTSGSLAHQSLPRHTGSKIAVELARRKDFAVAECDHFSIIGLPPIEVMTYLVGRGWFQDG